MQIQEKPGLVIQAQEILPYQVVHNLFQQIIILRMRVQIQVKIGRTIQYPCLGTLLRGKTQ